MLCVDQWVKFGLLTASSSIDLSLTDWLFYGHKPIFVFRHSSTLMLLSYAIEAKHQRENTLLTALDLDSTTYIV